MIVKNESAILERCLRSVLPHIDCYYICDTGSTDDTVALIKRVFGELPGQIANVEFRDFSQARNAALDGARKSALEFDYLLFIDADMELVATDNDWKAHLSHPAYTLRQVSGTLSYRNVRLLARSQETAHYVGATHEYLSLDAPPTKTDRVYMLDHACGSNRSEKTERDISLLTASLKDNPGDARSHFYLAQTLRESGRYEEAIEAYQSRIALGGWEEEVWYSLFMIARCYQGMKQYPQFESGCLKAYNFRPSRAEPLHALAQHYRTTGQNASCALICEAGLKIPPPDDILFITDSVYQTGFRYELSICGFYSSDPELRRLARRFCGELSIERDAAQHIRESSRANWKYYARNASELFGSARFKAIEHELPEGYKPCNPSLAKRDGEIWCVLRSVNYWISENEYCSHDSVIRTQNYLLKLDNSLNPVSSVPILEEKDEDGTSVVAGLEDVRLIFDGEKFRASATICRRADWLRQIVTFELTEGGQVKNLIVQQYEPDQHQKNWVPLLTEDGPRFIYYTDPTVILKLNDQTGQYEPWIGSACPWALENQRGSSGAIPFDDGWLYITHEVIFHGPSRTYLHRFVHLDKRFQVTAVSEAFYFLHLGIEFCCGLTEGPEEGQLLVSFGVEDNEAWLAILDVDRVRQCLIYRNL